MVTGQPSRKMLPLSPLILQLKETGHKVAGHHLLTRNCNKVQFLVSRKPANQKYALKEMLAPSCKFCSLPTRKRALRVRGPHHQASNSLHFCTYPIFQTIRRIFYPLRNQNKLNRKHWIELNRFGSNRLESVLMVHLMVRKNGICNNLVLNFFSLKLKVC